MKLMDYRDIEPQTFDVEGMVKGVTGRVAIGKKDGANKFCMRVFEIEPGGFTPKHVHDWGTRNFSFTRAAARSMQTATGRPPGPEQRCLSPEMRSTRLKMSVIRF